MQAAVKSAVREVEQQHEERLAAGALAYIHTMYIRVYVDEVEQQHDERLAAGARAYIYI